MKRKTQQSQAHAVCWNPLCACDNIRGVQNAYYRKQSAGSSSKAGLYVYQWQWWFVYPLATHTAFQGKMLVHICWCKNDLEGVSLVKKSDV